MGSDAATADTDHYRRGDEIPPQCQLCQPLGYRGGFINESEGMIEVARDDGGTKIVHCCERCADELFTSPGFTRYDQDLHTEIGQ